jgi:hypothetical protein
VVRRSFALIGGLVLLAALVGAAAHAAVAGLSGSQAATCGVERWAVKTLTDPSASSVKLKAKQTTIRGLRRRHPPAHLGATRNTGVETTTFQVRAALVEMKIEEDSDIHLVIREPGAPRLTMIVEFPAYACTRGATKSARSMMRTARARLVHTCGAPMRSHFSNLAGEATITGVGYFDTLHGQTGVAPNGIELHPVLAFTRASCKKVAAPSTGTSPPPVATPTTPAPPKGNCDPSYPTVCIPPPPPDLNCADVPYTNFKVVPPDPHHFDGDKDGIGCET